MLARLQVTIPDTSRRFSITNFAFEIANMFSVRELDCKRSHFSFGKAVDIKLPSCTVSTHVRPGSVMQARILFANPHPNASFITEFDFHWSANVKFVLLNFRNTATWSGQLCFLQNIKLEEQEM